MSFYCPHFNEPTNGCLRVKKECIPGRPGCVLRGKVRFLIDPDTRVEQRRMEKTEGGRHGRHGTHIDPASDWLDVLK